MAKALVNGTVLRWALERADMPPAVFASRLHVKPEQVESWLADDDRPTFAQAQKAAAVLAVPLGYLYLPKPPAEENPIPDLRTVGGQKGHLDVNLRSLLTDVLFKQDWYRDYREQNGDEHLPFVGRFTVETSVAAIAEDMRKVILGDAGRPKAGSYEDYLTKLMLAAEEVGIWVMRTGIVGNNTHRPLSVSAFRGLAIADKLVPLVLINGQDSKAAQIFTLAHELAHIWVGSSGISNVQLKAEDYGAHRAVERHCNKVAAEFLTPKAEFEQHWRPGVPFLDQVDALSNRFKVSRVVVARRAYDLNLIERQTYSDFFAMEEQRWRDVNRDSGGDFFKTLPVRNGRKFTKSVIGAAVRGSILLREASTLLGIQPSKIAEMHERLAS